MTTDKPLRLISQEKNLPQRIAEEISGKRKSSKFRRFTTYTLGTIEMVRGFEFPVGTFDTTPLGIEDAFLDLEGELWWIFNSELVVMGSVGCAGFEIVVKDFNLAHHLEFFEMLNAGDQLVADLRNDEIWDEGWLWRNLEGDWLDNQISHVSPPYNEELWGEVLKEHGLSVGDWKFEHFMAQNRLLRARSSALSKRVMAEVVHSGSCQCGRTAWPAIVRDRSKGGKPPLSESMCPVCELAHRREVGRQRLAKFRSRTSSNNQ